MSIQRYSQQPAIPRNYTDTATASAPEKRCGARCGNGFDLQPPNTNISTPLAELQQLFGTLNNAIATLLNNKPQSVPTALNSGATPGSINLGSTSKPASLGLRQPFSPQAFSETIKAVLTPDAQGKIHEEQFQHGITTHLLRQIKPDAAAHYQSSFDKLIGKNSFEDTVKAALDSTVKAGLISKELAERINGASFRAAQLDNKLDTLYDGKGGPNDSTIAVMNIDEAIKSAAALLRAMDNSEEPFSPRPLEAPSNVKPGAGVSGASSAGAVSGAGGAGGISQNFLWKPTSEKDGKLVVLLPAKYRGQVSSVGIYSALPPSAANLVEKGKHTGGGHMGRDHFRFGKSGGGYSDGVYVVATLQNGQQVNYKINDSASRNERS